MKLAVSKLLGAGAPDSVGDNPTFNAIFASSNFPTALSTIYKEVAFQDIPDLICNENSYSCSESHSVSKYFLFIKRELDEEVTLE